MNELTNIVITVPNNLQISSSLCPTTYKYHHHCAQQLTNIVITVPNNLQISSSLYPITYKYRHHCTRHQVVLLLCSCQLQILDNLQLIICSRMLFPILNGTFSKYCYLLCKAACQNIKIVEPRRDNK